MKRINFIRLPVYSAVIEIPDLRSYLLIVFVEPPHQ